ncbi:MAG TPA: plastocyanin/azurin family copper-binding protein [Thermoplasmata archaeon]|nr:plastocyanin/azurin family copper-binding protein [Thermoplasmata archaeon]
MDRPALRGSLRRSAMAFGVLALLLLAVGLPLAAPIVRAEQRGAALETEFGRPAAPPPPVTYSLNLTDAPSFLPSALAGAAPGAAVSVHLSNKGGYLHSFVLVKTPNLVLNRSWSPAQLDAYFAANGSLANVSLAGGASATANFTLPTTLGASYEFVSTVPYQFQAGMLGYLNTTAGPGVQLTEQTSDHLQFLPNQLVVNATHYPIVVDVQITNGGSDSHTWTLAPQANVFPTAENFSTYLKVHAPLANAPLSGPGAVVWANFTIPQPGEYEYFCTISGHFLGGMNGTLFVGVQPPALAALPSTAIVQIYVLAGAGSLLAVGVVLAFASTWMGRFPPRVSGHH